MRTAPQDIWVIDLVRGTKQRLTYSGGGLPSWSPDGRQIAFTTNGESPSVVRRIAANGSGKEEVLARLDRNADVLQWTADGQYLILTVKDPGKPLYQIWAARMPPGGKILPIVAGPYSDWDGNVSRDGKWIAYTGNETGEFEVYVQDFPPQGERRQISTGGGQWPAWRADGRELFYAGQSKIMSVEVKISAAGFEPGIPKPLFDLPKGSAFGGGSPDGQRFLLEVPNQDPGPPQPFTVVLNWPAGIKP
jgi:Tol biopolymer transport system component